MDTIAGIESSSRDKSNYYNYYNHAAYRGGWTYYGRATGNPLFFGHPDYLGVINNLMIAHHVAAMGYAGPVDWRFFTTYSRNYGGSALTRTDGSRSSGFRDNDRRDQWSFMLELKTGMFHPSLETAATLALDVGEAHEDNFGLMMTIRWNGTRLGWNAD